MRCNGVVRAPVRVQPQEFIMKKFITTALAAGALAAGGAASAQDLGSTILNILGFGAPTYSQNYGYGYGGATVQGQVYRDQYNRHFYYDQYGRQVYLNNSAPAIVGYDQWGRPLYNSGAVTYGTYGGHYNGNYAYGGNTWDADGDGVANHRDRWPNDARYR
jgi:hypothetical protein